MRISDWSSDVCSSDLVRRSPVKEALTPTAATPLGLRGPSLRPPRRQRQAGWQVRYEPVRPAILARRSGNQDRQQPPGNLVVLVQPVQRQTGTEHGVHDRSEERRVGKEGVSKSQ